MERQLGETRLFSLQDILESFTTALTELQVWAVALQALKFCEKCIRQQEDLATITVDMCSVYVNCLGDVIFSGRRDCDGTDLQQTSLQREEVIARVLESLGATLFSCLDYGVCDNEERVLSEDLERLVTLLTMRDASNLEGSIALSDAVEADVDPDGKSSHDEGILNDFATDGDSVALAPEDEDEDEQLDYVLKLQRFCALSVAKLPASFSRSNSKTDAPAQHQQLQSQSLSTPLAASAEASSDAESSALAIALGNEADSACESHERPHRGVSVAAARRCAAECAAMHVRAMRIALLLERARSSVQTCEVLDRASLTAPAVDPSTTSASQRRWASAWLRLMSQLANVDRRVLSRVEFDADKAAEARLRARITERPSPIEIMLHAIRERHFVLRPVPETAIEKPERLPDAHDLRARLCAEVLRARAMLRSPAANRNGSPQDANKASPKPTSSHEKLLDEILGGVRLRTSAGGIAHLEAETMKRRKSSMLSQFEVDMVRSVRSSSHASHRSASQPRRKNLQKTEAVAASRPVLPAGIDRRRQSVPENQLREQIAMRLRSASPGVASLDNLDSVDEGEIPTPSDSRAQFNNDGNDAAAGNEANPSSLGNSYADSPLDSRVNASTNSNAARRVVKAAQRIRFDDSSSSSDEEAGDDSNDQVRRVELQQSIALAFGRDSAQRYSLRRPSVSGRAGAGNTPEGGLVRSNTVRLSSEARKNSTPNGLGSLKQPQTNQPQSQPTAKVSRLHSSVTVPNSLSTAAYSENQNQYQNGHGHGPRSPQAAPACLELTLAEVRSVRLKCAAAELETLVVDADLFANVKAGRVCFNCLKSRFNFFQKGLRCAVCTRQSCSKCTRQLRVPDACAGRFESLPVLALSEQLHCFDLGIFAPFPGPAGSSRASSNGSTSPMSASASASARTSPFSTPVRSLATPLQRAAGSSSALQASDSGSRSQIDVCDACATLLKEIVANCAKELHRKGLLDDHLLSKCA